MKKKQGMLALLCAGVLAWPALAEDRTSGSDELGKLRALLEAQQREISELRQQVASAASQDVDAQRTEAMKQQIRAVLSETEFREQLMGSTLQAGYDKGFFIRSSDDKFMMKFSGLLQFRWTHYATRSDNRYLLPGFERDDRTGFDMQRVRFDVDGYAYDKNLSYHIGFKSDAPQNGNWVLDTAWIDYKFADEFQMRFGQFGLASTRTAGQKGSTQQFVDKSVVDAVFGLGTGVGIRMFGQLFGKRLDYYFDVVNSTSDDGNTAAGHTITNDPAQLDGNPAILFRTVWHALGDDPGKHFVAESDVDFTQNPALDFGFHYAFNDDQYDTITTRIPVPRIRPFNIDGGFALVSTNGLQINQFGFDTAFKWNGLSLTGEYILRIVDPRRASWNNNPLSAWYIVSGDRSTTVQHGAYVQLGYFLPIPGMEKKLEWVARVGGISALAERQEGTWEYATGMNYYIDGNNIKLQADMARIYEAPTTSSYSSLANVNDDALVFRVQLQLAF